LVDLINLRPWNSLGEKLSTVFFIALFPLFFFYHYLVAAISVPLIFGGWFGVVSAIAAFLFIPFGLRCFVNLRQNALLLFLITFALFMLVVSWLCIHYFWGANYQSHPDVVQQIGTTLIFWFSLFMVGLYWPQSVSRFRVILLISLGLMGVIIVAYLNPSNLMFDARRLWGAQDVATYQGFARSLVFTGLALLATIKRPRWLLIFTAVLCILLFFCGARSEFLGFLLIVPLILWVGFRRKITWLLVILLVTLLISFALILNNESLLASRQLQFINPDSWTSYQARQYLQEFGMIGILSSPISGDYAGQVRDFGSTGSYIHNFLSAWQQFGLVAFLLYFGLTVIGFWISFREVVFQRYHNSLAIMALYTNAFCLILILAAKSVFWPPVALGWGLAVAVLINKRVNSAQSKSTVGGLYANNLPS